MIQPTLKDMLNIIEVAKEAGKVIMQFYKKEIKLSYKDDLSPLTEADLASHGVICDALKKLYPLIPVLSEESSDSFKLNNKNSCFWCVDPLDGTKEFINENNEFTVNIALIKNQKPILGVICAPAIDIIYAAAQGIGAFKQVNNNDLRFIKVKSYDQNNLTFAVSRSHLDEKTKNLISQFNGNTLKIGSALKLAYVAEGVVDIYPRYGPTMVWDIAAGQCIIEEAGGLVISADKHLSMNYYYKNLKNASFIAMNHYFIKMDCL